ncbi:TetR/AcrR family transcriptional regulator [Methylobacterium sp. J-076]|uniref:TetR/AcrR family transcriptional regulator n=1 Tax=Methylobacterium sp. J-076 TaxID=2836655 RepID=UPI001FBA512B|nr:TetR/AcrR family transcriptional regulator [Methylobacterium sp. J-076]MCJ2013040.1 TetR/AcrR family transcriptional regulator [Methylobacterium sp. J-076]
MPEKRKRLVERPEIILDAADAVLLSRGARGLTIDAVAAEAKLSKGGVLHHFASKDALVVALVARKLATLRAGIAACEEAQPPEGKSPSRAMVTHFRQSLCEEDEISRALLLASVENRAALADYQDFARERLARLAAAEGGFGPGSVLFFAIVGISMGRALGFHHFAPEELDDVFAALDGIAQTAPSPAAD